MPILGLENVANAQKLFRATLFKSFDQAAQFIEPVAFQQTVPTGTIEVIGALANTQMREWLGERVVKDVSAEAFTVQMKEYENTVGIPRKAFEDDQWNLYVPKINGMGQAAGELKSRLLAAVLEGSSTATGYDGKKLAADDHPVLNPESTSTVDNSVVTALGRTAYDAAKLYFASLRNDSDAPMGVVPTHIVVKDGGSADTAATELFETTHIYEDSIMKPNPYNGKLTVIRNPYISSSTFWAVLVLNRVEKPVMIYNRYDMPKFTMIANEDSESVFLRNRIVAGTYFRTVATIGPWYLAYISTGAGA